MSIDLRSLVEREAHRGMTECECCGELERDSRLQRWTDGDGLEWLCRECLAAAVHEHHAAITDRARLSSDDVDAFASEVGQ